MPKATEQKVTDQASVDIRPVAIADMQIAPAAQREYSSDQAIKIAGKFNWESFQIPVVNYRNGIPRIVDGQHRVAAAKMKGYEDAKVRCLCYENLTEAEEAELFLQLNDRRAVKILDKFRIGVTAKREEELAITRVVESCGLRVSSNYGEGAIRATATLRTIYRGGDNGPEVLRRALIIIRDAYGTVGFEAIVIGGMGLVCRRYFDELDNAGVIEKLANARGGLKGLTNRAMQLKMQTGAQKAHCVAAAIVDILNSGQGGYKLTQYWNTRSKRRP